MRVEAAMNRRRVLVTGGAGNVAGWIARTAPTGIELHLTEHRTPVPGDVRSAAAAVHSIDLRRDVELRALVDRLRPDVIVHTAYSQVERSTIVDVTTLVANAARDVDASLLHLSTDVVFAGDAPPYAEDAVPDPVTEYGRWKAEAEERAAAAVADVCITRTSLVVSLDPLDRATAAMLGALADGTGVDLFRDELRQPIRSEDLAAELWVLIGMDRAARSGIWHLPGAEHLSRLELGRRLADRAGVDTSAIRVTSSADHPTPRPRDPALVSSRRSQLGVRLRPVDS